MLIRVPFNVVCAMTGEAVVAAAVVPLSMVGSSWMTWSISLRHFTRSVSADRVKGKAVRYVPERAPQSHITDRFGLFCHDRFDRARICSCCKGFVLMMLDLQAKHLHRLARS